MAMSPRPIGLAMPQLNRFGGYSPGATAATTPAVQAANEAENVRWYESGPFWTIMFLIVGYILVYRTLR
jgi:hypothetical protein